MPWEKRSLDAEQAEVLSDIEDLTGEPLELHPGSAWFVLSRVLAGAMFLQHEHVSVTAGETVPHGTTGTQLDAWSNDFGLERNLATKAIGQVSVSGIVGSVVPSNAVLQSNGGVRFKVDVGATLGGGDVLNVSAMDPGVAGNIAAGETLSFVAAHAGVDSAATVVAPGFSGGADDELDPLLLSRVLERLRNPPHGGNKADYERWAKEVPGVTRVWVSPEEQGKGTVVIRFMMDDVRAANSGIPQGDGAPDYTGDLALVRDHIEMVRPVTGERFYVAPVPQPFDVTISGLQPDTPEVRAAIVAEITALVERDGEPGGTLRRSRLVEAISVAAGESYHLVTIPAADVVHAVGVIPVAGNVTFV